MNHPPLDELLAGEHVDHLARCPRCRIQFRLYREAEGTAASSPHRDRARTAMTAALRSSSLGGASSTDHSAPEVMGYRLGERLRTGPDGDVWTARDEDDGSDVALLRIGDVDDYSALRGRFDALKGASHPGLLPLRCLSWSNGWWAACGAVSGRGPLAWMLEPDTADALSPEIRIRQLVRSLVIALGALHERGVAHGAVDADHILVGPGGAPVLVEPRWTDVGTMAADWAGLGALLHQLLAGAPPKGEPRLPPGWPEDLVELCRYLLRPEPNAVGALRRVVEATPNDGGAGYRDLGLLGKGGMAEIRRVADASLARELALKQGPAPGAPSLAVERFLAEAQATAQLQHPGVVSVHALGRDPDGRPWFTMDIVRGRTLGALSLSLHAASSREVWGTTKEGWTLVRLVRAYLQACETVAYAHSRGVVHRDLKPENVMVGEFGEVIVLDWGIAKVLGRPDATEVGTAGPVRTLRQSEAAAPTARGVMLGTPGFMAPEQAGGAAGVDRRADIYGLGALLYGLLIGRPPHQGKSLRELITNVQQASFVPPMEASRAYHTPPPPPELAAVCERAMEKDPEDRYPRVRDLVSEVEAWF